MLYHYLYSGMEVCEDHDDESEQNYDFGDEIDWVPPDFEWICISMGQMWLTGYEKRMLLLLTTAVNCWRISALCERKLSGMNAIY